MAPTLSRAILTLELENLQDVHRFLPAIVSATEQTTEHLLVVVFCKIFNVDANLSRTGSWKDVQAILTSVYVETTHVAQKAGRLLMNVDVLLRGLDNEVGIEQTEEWQGVFCVEGDSATRLLPRWTSNLPRSQLKAPTEPPSELPSGDKDENVSASLPSTFPVVALGGTFDHLHSGHKILLSMAAWIAHEKVIVGVTHDALLQKKTNKAFLESLDDRIKHVRRFLEFFKPGLVYDVVPIVDVYGPTAVDPNIQALVVSKETLSGASTIAKLRKEKNLPPLECCVIDVISATSANLDAEDMEMLREKKMSSTFIREYLAIRSGSHASK